MPTIPKLKDFRQKYFRSKAKVPKRDNLNNKEQKYLTNRRYREFRTQCLSKHPICELSLIENQIAPAEHTHHLIKYFTQPSEDLRYMLLLDPDNIICVTQHLHQAIHYNPSILTDAQKQYLKERKDKVYAKYIQAGIIINYTEDKNSGKYFGDQE